MLRKSSTNAKGSPWKLPPEMMRSSSEKMVGLSVTELISRSTTEATYRDAAERIGVLYPRLFLFLEFGAFEQGADVAGSLNLSGMGAGFLNLRQEGIYASVVGIQGNGSDYVCVFGNFECL